MKNGLEKLDWGRLGARLARYAASRLDAFHPKWVDAEKTMAGGKSAEDFAFEAIEAVLTGRRKLRADPTDEDSVLHCLYDVVKSMISNAYRSKAAKNVPIDTYEVPYSPSFPDDVRIIDSVEQLVADDPQLKELIGLWFAGTTKPQDVAEAMHMEYNEVVNLIKRLKRRLKGFLAEENKP